MLLPEGTLLRCWTTHRSARFHLPCSRWNSRLHGKTRHGVRASLETSHAGAQIRGLLLQFQSQGGQLFPNRGKTLKRTLQLKLCFAGLALLKSFVDQESRLAQPTLAL